MEFDRQIDDGSVVPRGGPIRVNWWNHGPFGSAVRAKPGFVICIREDLAKGSPPSLFSRGQRRPLFFGAASKVILPYVPPHRLIRIFEHHHRDIARAGLGTDWQGFRDNLAAIRRDGYCVSYGEINPGVFGVAAPVFNADGLVVGSILIGGVAERLGSRDLSNYGQVTVVAAKRLTEFLARDHNDLVHPPRAFGSISSRARR